MHLTIVEWTFGRSCLGKLTALNFRHIWNDPLRGTRVQMKVPASCMSTSSTVDVQEFPALGCCYGCAPSEMPYKRRIGPIWAELNVNGNKVHTCAYSVLVMLLNVACSVDGAFHMACKRNADILFVNAVCSALSASTVATSTRNAWVESLPADVLFLSTDGIPDQGTGNWTEVTQLLVWLTKQTAMKDLFTPTFIRLRYRSTCTLCQLQYDTEETNSQLLHLTMTGTINLESVYTRVGFHCTICARSSECAAPTSFQPPAILFVIGTCANTYNNLYDVAGARYGALGEVLGDGTHNVLKMWKKDEDIWVLADDIEAEWISSKCPNFAVLQTHIRIVLLKLLDTPFSFDRK